MKEYCFGVDVGGTTVKIGFFKTTGDRLDAWEIKTRTENGGENIIPDICKSLDEKLAEHNLSAENVEGVGVGLPGPVLSDGTLLGAVNLGWGKFNVADAFSKAFHNVRVVVGNDANVAALGESWKGGGKDFDDIVMITLGTGVGSGIIIGNKIVTGFNGGAGEVGHMTVEKDEPEKCNCGRSGCLEQYTSATGVVRLAKRYMANNEDTAMADFGENITAKDVFDLAKSGDVGARTVVKKMANYLGKAMADIATVINPQAFIIGGGVSKAGVFLIDAIKPVYEEMSFKACSGAAVKLAELGNDAGMYGAAALIIG